MFRKFQVRIRWADWIIPAGIFILALAVRLVFDAQARHSVYWRAPMVDALIYDKLAVQVLREGWLAPYPTVSEPYAAYYQPPLYHLFLALVYLVFGHSTFIASIVQYVIGSLSCVLTYFIGQAFFSRKIGIIAAVACALTSTQIYYDGRLLPPVLVTALNLTVILLLAKQAKSPSAWRLPVIGLLIGLSAVARPDILLFVPVLIVWMLWQRKFMLPRRFMVWTLVFLACIVLPIGLVTLRNVVVGRDFAVISWNGGVNFYIGNHPNMEATLAVRPGLRWETLMHLPQIRAGLVRHSDWNSWFYKTAFSLMWKHKKRTLLNFVRKFLWVWHGPEIQRNEDEYYLRRVSPLYAALLWRKGKFGFPFGVIAPLALLGMVISWHRRNDLFPLYGYIATQVLMLVAFFPCTRYRAPMVPVLLIFGASAFLELVQLIRGRRIGELVPLVCMLTAFAFLPSMYPPRFQGTPSQIEAENCRLLASGYYLEGDYDRAIRVCKKGLELEPDSPELHKWLLDAYKEQGDYSNAEKEALECIRLFPAYAPLYFTLLEIYEAEGKTHEANELRATIKEGLPSSVDIFF
jgi:4-amino-4-deoxy-L-arabinose transferase-like glycosyltransferase